MNDSLLLVNGTQNPMLDIPAQIVRLRLLNGSQERNFNFGFTANKSFYVIGNDGGLLHAPVAVTRIRLSPGERAEVLLDVSTMQGQQLYLMSYASELPSGVQGGTPMPGMDSTMYSPINGIDFNILQLNVVAPTADPVTVVPSSLVSFTPWTEAEAVQTRNILITAQNMMSMDGPFYFNGQLFDMNRIDYRIPLDNVEIWSITNQTMVAHPFHLHDMEFFVLDRDGVTPNPEERGYKDVVMLAPMETVRFITKFEDYADSTMSYMYHCHILMHEDDGMMGQFVVMPLISGTQEINLNDELNIYPNPVSDFVTLQTSSEAQVQVVVSDALGKIVFSSSVIPVGNKIKLNTENWTAGTYSVSVKSSGSFTTKAIVKN
jgi:bilirubin oxidase